MKTLEDTIIDASYVGKNPPASKSEAKHIAKAVREWIRSQGWYKMPQALPSNSRQRTAARLRAMRNALIWYADHMPNQYENNYAALDIEQRRQEVQEVRDVIREPRP